MVIYVSGKSGTNPRQEELSMTGKVARGKRSVVSQIVSNCRCDQAGAAPFLQPLSRNHAVGSGERFTRRRGGRGERTLDWKACQSPQGERLPASKCSRPALLSALSAAPPEITTAWIRLKLGRRPTGTG